MSDMPITAPPDSVLIHETNSLLTIRSENPSPALMRDYCLFKLGYPPVRSGFLTALVTRVGVSLGEQISSSPSQWQIATAATFELACEFASLLSKFLDLAQPVRAIDVGIPAGPDTEYSNRSRSERKRIAATFYRYRGDARGRSFILIDDLINTGSALHALVTCLHAHGANPDAVHCFVFIKASFQRPERERELVEHYTAEFSPESLAKLVNHPDYYRTSATMFRVLSRLSTADARRFFNALLPERRSAVLLDARAYYGNDALPQSMLAGQVAA